MLLEFTVQDKGIVHQDAPPRCQLREELYCGEVARGIRETEQINARNETC